MNTLYYGDNLDILREYIKDDSVDLIYLDPPFNSNQDYNVLFKEASGDRAAAQILAFEDSWHWHTETQDAPRAYEEIMLRGGEVADMIRAFKTFLRTSDMMAYLVMMAPRLVEMHRVLKPTGSIYLHCDPTASHYLKLLMDAIYGGENFRNEIVWRRAQPKSHTSVRMSRAHDVILFYAKTSKAQYHQQYSEHDPAYIEKFYKYVEPESGRRYTLGDLTNPNRNRPNLTYEFPPKSGTVRVWRWTKDRMMKAWKEGRVVLPKDSAIVREKRYLDDMEGTPVTDFWDNIEHLHGINRGPESKGEGLGYPTQKPEALLERIIEGSSSEGDVVLDPFCGCGTAVAVAQRLNRNWIGIDITHLAINLIERRLKDGFGLVPGKHYKEFGIPKTIEEAKALAAQDKFEFQKWALVFLADAHPHGTDWKKGADRGIDGVKSFFDGADRHEERIMYSVKGGHVDVKDVRDLGHVVKREKAAIGILITLEKPTKPMRNEASEAGYYYSSWRNPKHLKAEGWDTKHPRLQIYTVEELMDGVKPDLPMLAANMDRTFRKARSVKSKGKKAEGNEEMEL